MDPRTNLAGEKHSPASCVRLLLLAGTTGGDHAASLELLTSFQAVYYNSHSCSCSAAALQARPDPKSLLLQLCAASLLNQFMLLCL